MRHYERLSALLDELDAEPETVELHERIRSASIASTAQPQRRPDQGSGKYSLM